MYGHGFWMVQTENREEKICTDWTVKTDNTAYQALVLVWLECGNLKLNIFIQGVGAPYSLFYPITVYKFSSRFARWFFYIQVNNKNVVCPRCSKACGGVSHSILTKEETLSP